MLGVSQTARDKAHPSQQQPSAVNNTRTSIDRDGPSTVNLYPPSGPASSSARSLAASAANFAPRGSSLNPSVAPGSFSSELRSQMNSSRAGSRADLFNNEKIEENEATMAEQKLNALREQLNRELKIKEGSENMLDALNSKKAKQTKEQRARVENELNASNNKIRELRQRIAEAQAVKLPPSTPTRSRTAEPGSHPANGLRSPHSVSRSGAGSDFDEPVEQSPTFSLTEILQDLEVEGMGPEYYVSRGNALVDLLRRHPSLKYDLVWPVFGLRMQVMLLSDAREVVAAGYRMVRYAISDISSLKKIRNLNTDYLVIT